MSSRFKIFFKGVTDVSPLMIPVIPFGIIFGVLAIDLGLSPITTMGMSIIIFGGASQIIFLQLFSAGASSLVIISSVGAPTELIITKDEAPAEKSCKNIICDAPPKIMIDIPIVVIGDKPRSIASTPKIIPKGMTGIIKGLTSVTPLKNILNLLLILKNSIY